MGIISLLFKKKNTEIKAAKDYTRETVHEQKNQFTGAVIKSQNRIDKVIDKTDKLQEDFRNSIVFKIAIATGGRQRGFHQ